MSDAEQIYRVQEFAALAGVTVRALHHYDRAGLLRPTARTASGHRRYHQEDLLRLQQILTLKQLGFTLEEIGALLTAPAYDLRESLAIQKAAIEQRIGQLQGAVLALGRTIAALEGQRAIDWLQVVAIIQGVQEARKGEWLQRYFPPERWAWLSERAALTPPELVERSAAAWAELYAEFGAARSLPPEHPEVQRLAERMDQLIGLFTGGDRAIEQGLSRLHSEPGSLPAAYRMRGDVALRELMGQALTIYREQHRSADSADRG
jgi:MerR family transcriptional regulator, thiopeptide resistance regulator